MNYRYERKEKRLCTFIALVVISIYVVNMSAEISQIVDVSASIISNFFKVLLGIYFLFLLPIICKRVNRRMIIFCFLTFLVALINYAIFTAQVNVLQNTMFSFFSVCFLTYIVGATVYDYKILEGQLLKVSYIISVLSFVYLIAFLLGKVKLDYTGSYSMGLGYSMLIPALVLSLMVIRNRRIIDLVCLIVILVGILAYGSRGPLIGVVLFFAFYSIRFLVLNKKYLYVILVVLGFFLLVFYFNAIIHGLTCLFEKIGIQSRTLKLADFQNLYISGRENIYLPIKQAIIDNPFKIRGVNAEYLLVNTYAHNIVLELLYQFGLLLGGVALIAILYGIVKTLLDSKMGKREEMIALMMFASIPQLFVSSSLWISYSFWLWIALLGNKRNYCCEKNNNHMI